jgi:hypothetical protein
LLSDIFYLPWSNGQTAKETLDCIRSVIQEPGISGEAEKAEFNRSIEAIQSLFKKLTELKNRELFATFNRQLWEIKEEVQLHQAYLNAENRSEFESGDHLPGTFRGGFSRELQGLIGMSDSGRFFPRG